MCAKKVHGVVLCGGWDSSIYRTGRVLGGCQGPHTNLLSDGWVALVLMWTPIQLGTKPHYIYSNTVYADASLADDTTQRSISGVLIYDRYGGLMGAETRIEGMVRR